MGMKYKVVVVGLSALLFSSAAYSARTSVRNFNEVLEMRSASQQRQVVAGYDNRIGEWFDELHRLDLLSDEIGKYQKLLLDKEREISENIINEDFCELEKDISDRDQLERKFQRLVKKLKE